MVKAKKTTIKQKIQLAWKMKIFYFMLLPTLVGLIIFNYVPMFGIQLAFKEYWEMLGIWNSPWIGLDNFERIFNSTITPKFFEVLFNTVFINICRLVFGFPAPIILALLLNEVRNKTQKKIMQTIIYLPYFISWVVISGIMKALLNLDNGIISNIIFMITGNRIDFMTSNSWAVPLVVISDIWKNMGWGTIIYLAALAGVPQEIYEAATVDGAGKFRQVFSITLPSIVGSITILLILNVGGMLTGSFDQIMNIYNPDVYDTIDIVDTYIYRIGISGGEYELATAVGLFLSLINFIFLCSANLISKKLSGISIY